LGIALGVALKEKTIGGLDTAQEFKKELRKVRNEQEILYIIEQKINPSYSGCLEWTGNLNNGYARIGIDYKEYLVHRLIYEIKFGEIPQGFHVHHKCKNKKCINIEHLDCVSAAVHAGIIHREHVLQMAKYARELDKSKTHCKNKHEYNEKNTYFYRSKRFCRICRKKNQQDLRDRRKVEKYAFRGRS
jgi:hypothetical protein